MAASGALVVRLEGGKSVRRELRLNAGRPHLPFSVGARGDWRVDADARGHVMIAFNGVDVFIGALGTEVEISGVRVVTRWTTPVLPAVVAFGDARLVLDFVGDDDSDAVTCSPRAPASRVDAQTEIADEARLAAALALARRDLAVGPTSLSRPLTPPPLPRRPQIRLITRPWGAP